MDLAEGDVTVYESEACGRRETVEGILEAESEETNGQLYHERWTQAVSRPDKLARPDRLRPGPRRRRKRRRVQRHRRGATARRSATAVRRRADGVEPQRHHERRDAEPGDDAPGGAEAAEIAGRVLAGKPGQPGEDDSEDGAVGDADDEPEARALRRRGPGERGDRDPEHGVVHHHDEHGHHGRADDTAENAGLPARLVEAGLVRRLSRGRHASGRSTGRQLSPPRL